MSSARFLADSGHRLMCKVTATGAVVSPRFALAVGPFLQGHLGEVAFVSPLPLPFTLLSRTEPRALGLRCT